MSLQDMLILQERNEALEKEIAELKEENRALNHLIDQLHEEIQELNQEMYEDAAEALKRIRGEDEKAG